MPKLLQISVAVAKGSQGKIANQIGDLAIQNGWESWIAYSAHQGCGETDSNLIRIGGHADFYEHALESRIFDNHGLASRYVTRKLIKKIGRLNPDIIHIHNIHGYYLNYKILFRYLSQIKTPVIWTLHDCWPVTGHCTHFVTANCDKWKTGCYSCPLKKDYPSSWIFDRSCRNWQTKNSLFTSLDNLTIVPVSYWLEDIVRESFLCGCSSVVINNGIDLHVFRPKKNREQNQKFTILGVANVWTDDKGLKEFERLSRNTDYQVMLVGGKPGAERNMPDGVKYIPRTTSQQELAAYYSQADVFVNPTYADTFPTVNMEAIACGTPVITYRTGGSPESVPPEVGYVVEKGNINALAEAIEKLRNNPIPPETCRKYAEEHFDKDKCFSEYVKLYESKVNLRSAFDKAKAQAMIGVCFHELQPKLEENGVKDKLYFEWLGLAGKIQQRNEVLNRQCVTLQQKLSERGIRSTILKGQGIAALYGAELSSLRQPGDIDVYVDCGLDKAVELAKSIGQTKIEWDYKHLHLNVFKGTSVEVHYRPQVFLNPWRNKKLQRYFKDNEDRLFGGKAYLKDCGEITVPEPDINVVYLLSHMYHHLFSEGFGHKQVMDLYYSLKAADDRQRIAEDIDILGMRKFAQGMMWVLSECYGMPESEMFCTPDEKEGRFLLDKIVGGGNFSNKLHGNRARRLLQVCKVNMALLIHYPGDAMAAPLYYIWHFFWKRSYARKHHLAL